MLEVGNVACTVESISVSSTKECAQFNADLHYRVILSLLVHCCLVKNNFPQFNTYIINGMCREFPYLWGIFFFYHSNSSEVVSKNIQVDI